VKAAMEIRREPLQKPYEPMNVFAVFPDVLLEANCRVTAGVQVDLIDFDPVVLIDGDGETSALGSSHRRRRYRHRYRYRTSRAGYAVRRRADGIVA
jgi:hypothetical protein